MVNCNDFLPADRSGLRYAVIMSWNGYDAATVCHHGSAGNQPSSFPQLGVNTVTGTSIQVLGPSGA